MTEYTALVEDMKALEQPLDPLTTETDPEMVLLPMAEDEWDTRPDTVSYGIVRYDFEADALGGDDIKVATAYEGSADLYSLVRSGAGWVPLITQTLTKHCGGCWSLAYHGYEQATGYYHWQWAFQFEG